MRYKKIQKYLADRASIVQEVDKWVGEAPTFYNRC